MSGLFGLVREPGGERADERDAVGLEQRQLRLPRGGAIADHQHERAAAGHLRAARRELERDRLAVAVAERDLDDRGQRRVAGEPVVEVAHDRAILGRERAEHRDRHPLLGRVAERRTPLCS